MPSSNVNNVWGSQKLEVELECPSGQRCLVKKPDPQQLVEMGIIDKVDVLTKLVDTKHVKRVKGKQSLTPAQVDVETISKNPKIAMDIMTLADRVVESVVLEPSVKRPVRVIDEGLETEREVKLAWSDRVEGQIYTDMIDFMDRMYIFQHAVGGNTDLATFREQLELTVSNVANGDKVSSKTVTIPGN